jgi:hypothetical protein
MPRKSRQPSLLGMFMPDQVRSPRRKRPLGLPSTSEMRYFPPQLGVIRGMSVDSVLIGLRTRELLQQLLEARCKLSRVLMLIEDLHWTDSAS